MKKFVFLLALYLTGGTFSSNADDHTLYVNPLIGTQTDDTGALSGSTFPGASMPQGMVQLSPDTEEYVTWDPCSGYDYNKDQIYGFTHTHLSGTGCTDLIDVSLFPLTENISLERLMEGGFHQSFDHAGEEARPGYYEVMLKESQVKVELSATPRVGIHRYTFPDEAEQTIVLDLDRSTFRGEAYYTGKRDYQILQSQMRIVDEHTVEGYRIITGWAKLRHVYFRAEFSKPIRSHQFVNGKKEVGSTDIANGKSLRAALHFDKGGEPTIVKVAISPVDAEGASRNMEAEARTWNFDRYVTEAHDTWQKALDCVDVEGTEKQKSIFYTGLYHLLLQPNVMSDSDGRYMDTNYQQKQMRRETTYYSTFSLWDTFRAAHPLYLLLKPDITAQFIGSMLLHHQTYGYLPIWDLWGQDNYCMIGNHAIPVLSDAILAELSGIDAEACYQAMKESSMRSHPNSPFDLWEKLGYMPQNKQPNSVSITMEQAFDDWCVAAVAKKLGHTEDYEHFLKRSQNYRNLYDKEIGFFRPRDDQGKWIEPFDPLSYEEPSLIEGNAWQYMWFAPQDPEGLIELLGGEKTFLQKLNENFTLTAKSGETNGNASGFIGQYAHGNEPSHHTAYLFNFAGQPWRTQELVDQVRNEFYNDTPCGYAGNDDCGQMSAWYIFSALGFYPFNAGSAEYVIGTPLFPSATLHLGEGRDFRIVANGVSDRAIYVKSVKLNGEPLKGLRLTHQQIVAGGTLEFQMSEKH